MHKLFFTHARDFIRHLQQGKTHFSITCDTSLLTFDPPLSKTLREQIGDVAFFILSGYSFQSIQIQEQDFVFEAGLIAEEGDIGTIITVPYLALIQILLHEENSSQSLPIYVNPFKFSQHKIQTQSDSKQAILSKNANILGVKK